MPIRDIPDLRLRLLWGVSLAAIPIFSALGWPMRQALAGLVGSAGVGGLVVAGLVVGAGLGLLWLVRVRGNGAAAHAAWLVPVLVAVVYLLPLAAERVHFLLFAPFGALTLRLFRFLPATGTILVVALADEAFQWLLPDRAGDPRDVLLNVAGAVCGAAVVLLARRSGPAGERA